MIAEIERLVGAFEQGRITRRQLVSGLGAFVAGIVGVSRLEAAQPPTSTFEAVGLNHLALDVTDLRRSKEFYQKHLALTVRHESEHNCFLGCGEHFVALFKSSEPGMDHYCYSIKGYQPDEAMKKLTAAGLKPRRHDNRVYFDDPDGLTVQVSAQPHRP